jgi:para-nitrobenzyl esterase
LATIFSGAEAPDLAALRDLSAESIISAYAANPKVLTNFDWLTIVDGDVLPDEVNKIFAEGKQADVPVLIGSNADEATTFDPAIGATASVDYAALLNQFVGATLAGDNKTVFDLYPAQAEVARDSYTRFNTDAMFTQPMRLWADYMGKVSSPAYLYWWNWRPVIDGSDQFGAFHAAEIPYVFGNLATFDIEANPRDIAFADKMQTIWTNFAKNGNPSSNGIIDWPAYAQNKPTTAVLGPEIGLQEGIRSDEVDAITAGYTARRN